jgi:hypothetical protein
MLPTLQYSENVERGEACSVARTDRDDGGLSLVGPAIDDEVVDVVLPGYGAGDRALRICRR